MLWTGTKDTAAKVSMIIKNRFHNFEEVQDLFEKPKCNIFDMEKNFMCKGVSTGAIENDYWQSGQKDFGKKFLQWK